MEVYEHTYFLDGPYLVRFPQDRDSNFCKQRFNKINNTDEIFLKIIVIHGLYFLLNRCYSKAFYSFTLRFLARFVFY